MVWHPVLLLLSPLAALIGHLMPDDRDREILALRQQVLILQRQLGKRPQLRPNERLALVLTCSRMKKQRLLRSLLVVKPDTVVGWHRQVVRRHLTFRQKRKPGRPPIDPEAERLVVQIARGDLRGGYTKTAGDVRRLGFASIAASPTCSIRAPASPGWGRLARRLSSIVRPRTQRCLAGTYGATGRLLTRPRS